MLEKEYVWAKTLVEFKISSGLIWVFLEQP